MINKFIIISILSDYENEDPFSLTKETSFIEVPIWTKRDLIFDFRTPYKEGFIFQQGSKSSPKLKISLHLGMWH